MVRAASDLMITPSHPHLGALVDGVDLTETLDEPTFRRIFDAFQATHLPIWNGIVPRG
jgi:alpha-ketoglutarate-dependent taurine dioxygenase